MAECAGVEVLTALRTPDRFRMRAVALPAPGIGYGIPLSALRTPGIGYGMPELVDWRTTGTGYGIPVYRIAPPLVPLTMRSWAPLTAGADEDRSACWPKATATRMATATATTPSAARSRRWSDVRWASRGVVADIESSFYAGPAPFIGAVSTVVL